MKAPKKLGKKGRARKEVKLEKFGKPWAMSSKKSEPDDRPRPMAPSGHKSDKQQAKRTKRLEGIML